NVDLQRTPENYNQPETSWTSDRKSTRLNSSHLVISYAVFCLKKKTDFARAPHMKQKQNSSTRASALQLTLALSLTSISAILFASSASQPTGAGPGPNNP